VDPEEMRREIVSGVVAELQEDLRDIKQSLGGVSNRTQNEILEKLRIDIPEWNRCDVNVREFLREAESKRRLQEYGSANLNYGRAVEKLLRDATGSKKAMLGDLQHNPFLSAMLRANAKPPVDFDALLDDINVVRRWKNAESHSDRRSVPSASEGSTDEIRQRTIRIVNAILGHLTPRSRPSG
jgi:hypothetical protein